MFLPAPKLDAFDHCVRCAGLLAEHGRVGEGYALLQVGWRAARDAALEGLVWAPTLADCYRTALDEYQVRYGVLQ